MLQILVLTFCIPILDFIFLGLIAKNLYMENLLPFARLKPGADGIDVNFAAAFVVYALMIAGLYFFVLRPTQPDVSAGGVFLKGLFFGVVLYGVYEFTNLAVVREWPVTLVAVDTLWGSCLMGIAAWLAFLLAHKLAA